MSKYRVSFTAAALVPVDSVKLAKLYLELADWSLVRKEVLKHNTLQAKTQSSLTRMYIEISSRLKQLQDSELELLIDGSNQDQCYLLWLAVCRYYRLIEEFAVEVLREKYLSMDFHLTHHDYDVFFNQKAEWNEELEALSSSTKYKMRQVLFKMLRESGMLSADNIITPVLLSPLLARQIFKPSNSQAIIYPITDGDLGGLLTW
ncbi:MAG: DUF1819 family protein [Mariprofundaceae bacterium]|nr:DUF1819 family protein [Mariprofundaceae bacterium]